MSEEMFSRIRPQNTIKGSRIVKLLAYLVLIYSCLMAIVTAVASVYFYDRNMYGADAQNFYKQMIYPLVLQDRRDILSDLWNGREAEAEERYARSNLSFAYHDKNGDLRAGNYAFDDASRYFCYVFDDYYYSGQGAEENRSLYLYVRRDLSYGDKYSEAFEDAAGIYPHRNKMPVLAGVHIVLALAVIYFLLCAAGHVNGQEGICESIVGKVPVEILTAVFAMGIYLGYDAVISCADGEITSWLKLMLAALAVGVVWCMAFCSELAIRSKMGTMFKYSIIRYILLGIYIWADKSWGVIRKIPLVFKTMLVLGVISVIELIVLLLCGNAKVLVFWGIEKIILFPICIFIAFICKKLLWGTEALAEGRLSYKVNTVNMFGDFKEHGENLNRISDGIAKAVDERIKSEHLKTELISNVSHDIKTPLTSIINYADLIGHEPTENPKIQEYAEVLLRQSKRLKKLLDDLLEASKATTGTLECNFVPCEIGVLLTQACGEYEKRFEECNLELILNKPEQEMMILADGRHMWRAFDNLLNNICKYSQENSRVYLSMQQSDNHVEIIFRNMSKYALNVSAEELQERFVRGDKSRHMEGNGLGLSITRSLVELQNGFMDVLIDGDLFKVILRFEIYREA